MKKIIILLAVLCSAAYAALPPFAQSVREIEAILADPKLYEILGSAEWIRGIERTDQGYVVLTRSYSLKVNLTYLPQHHPGPAKFALEFQTPEPH